MKKFFLTLAFAGVLSLSANAQDVAGHWGIQGGVNTDKFSTVDQLKSIVDNKAVAGWHIGLTCKLDLPLYFSIQPSVLYENKNSNVYYSIEPDVTKTALSTQVKTHNINVPIAVQWGPDLGFIRPFVEAVPFADFLLGGNFDTSRDLSLEIKDYLNTVQFGVGLGAGIEIWKLQFKLRYNWKFGTWKDVSANPFKDWNGQQQGLTASVAFFFK